MNDVTAVHQDTDKFIFQIHFVEKHYRQPNILVYIQRPQVSKPWETPFKAPCPIATATSSTLYVTMMLTEASIPAYMDEKITFIF